MIVGRRIARAPLISAPAAAVITAIACVSFTAWVTISDRAPFSRTAAFHLGLETADAMVLVFVAAVLLGRFHSNWSRRNLLMTTAFVVLAVKNLGYAFANAVDETISGNDPIIWATATTGLLGAGLLAASAVLPDQRARHAQSTSIVLGSGVALVAVIFVLAFLFENSLPTAFKPWIPGLTEVDLLSGHPAKIMLDMLTGACYGVAALAFTRLAERHDDEFMRWLGLGAVIATVAFVNYALYPSRFTALLYGGDILWIGAVAALLYGAVREISNLEAAFVRSAVLAERKRVARDLHDGVAQELAYISSQMHWLIGRPEDERSLRKVLESAERALDESRGAIASLNRPLDEPLDIALGHTAGDIAERVGARLKLDLDSRVEVAPEWRDALLRIVREAVGNAARHGHARSVSLRLRNGDTVTLAVTDDGDGFDLSAPRSSQSFGLTGMRERTESLGGRFSIASTPGVGTTVEVEIP